MKKPEITLKPNTYQPRKSEMLADVSIDTTPDELAKAVVTPVKIKREEQD